MSLSLSPLLQILEGTKLTTPHPMSQKRKLWGEGEKDSGSFEDSQVVVDMGPCIQFTPVDSLSVPCCPRLWVPNAA